MSEPFVFPEIPDDRKTVLEPGQSIHVDISGLYFGWCEPCGKVVLGLPPADSCPHCSGDIEHIRDVDFDEDADE